jgi:DnaJ-class molecular chaperone
MFDLILSFFSDDNTSDIDLDSDLDHTDSLDEQHHNHSNEVRFGAGTCSRCGGAGYTTWPSSGSQEACWYCDGSGVAH